MEGSRSGTGTGTGTYAAADGAWEVRSLEEEEWGMWAGNGNGTGTGNGTAIGNGTGNGTEAGNRAVDESGGHAGRNWDSHGEEEMGGPRWGIATETETESRGFEGHTQDEGVSTPRSEDAVSVSGSVVRDGFGFCSRCGAPWNADADDEQDPKRLSANHGNDNGNSESQGWGRRAVYGQEGLNRLRSLQTTTSWGNGTSTSELPDYQPQNYWWGKHEKNEDDDDDDEERNWDGEKTIHVGYRNVRRSDENSQGNNGWNSDGWGENRGWGNQDPTASVAVEETYQASSHEEEQDGWGVHLRAEVAETSSHKTSTTTVVSSSQHTHGTSTTNRKQSSDSTIKDSFEYMKQWGGLKGSMNAFLVNPERTDAVYQAGKLILSLRAQGASFARPRRKFWDEELARVLAGDMF
ncbi:hypothetical protein SMACR_09549 [Sordaria macrospora]|uniref:WGS project CABT00000000 data, contig 2.99 n=2 Tax=Sordaria macrospora TaxID=5147 RepID=F7WC69_SORMK|nr:uncharacterized protein SMAC_09549 [Sordaria macrospora k-hell]KAA8631452.1 hypothetical protein SMACR_09549 [Sordaria macrospora]WPJ65661.1 hypothetical protein SMAC4_09549 [Sordaria macrospora]CCC14551.1 unnamed protein product [Sordaria macrospora k-hell]